MKEYTNSDIEKIKKNLDTTKKRSIIIKDYYEFLIEKEEGNKQYFKNYEKHYKRMNKCLNYWRWDLYKKNKLMDLQVVNRCKSRFCPNCVRINNGKAYYKFKDEFEKLVKKDFLPLFLTLTVPNVCSNELDETVKQMGKSFSKLFRIYNSTSEKVLFKKRKCKFVAGLRSLEITYNKITNMYHPHYHIIVFLDKISLCSKDLEKNFKTGLKKNNKDIYYSKIEYQLSQVWTLLFTKTSLKQYVEDDILYDKNNNIKYYLTNLESIDFDKGMLELFKYTFKDTDIDVDEFESIDTHPFIVLFVTLTGKRLRQGYGLLYGKNFDCDKAEMEKENDSIEQYLKFEELADKVIIENITDLQLKYHNYKKISRFKYNLNDIE